MSVPAECIACYGERVVDGGEFPIVCPACNGEGVLSPERVEFLNLGPRYEAFDRLEAEGASFVGAVREAIG